MNKFKVFAKIDTCLLCDDELRSYCAVTEVTAFATGLDGVD